MRKKLSTTRRRSLENFKRLAFHGTRDHRQGMGEPNQNRSVDPPQIQELNQKLSTFRHNINNHLSLIVAAVELIRRKPDMAARLIETVAEQPQKISEEMRRFSEEFDRILGIQRTIVSENSPPSSL